MAIRRGFFLPILVALAVCLAPASARALDGESCILAASKASAKLARSGLKEAASCYKAASKESLDSCHDLAACLDADRKGKVAKSAAKLESLGDLGASCIVRPPVGSATELATMVWAGRSQSHGMSTDALGVDSGSLVGAEKGVANCRKKVLGAMGKLYGAGHKSFAKCLKSGLRDASIDDAPAIAACMDGFGVAPDSKVAKAVTKLNSAVTDDCAELDLATGLPGACSASGDVPGCLNERVRCRVCQQISNTHALAADCDTFDDGAANASCSADDGRCNEAASLCDRPFDQVAYATTHNAFSNFDENWAGPNQSRSMGRQMADGVRGLMLDVYNFDGGVFLCHGVCNSPGPKTWREPFSEGLAKILAFLERRPSEVLTLIFESYIDESTMESELLAAGLGPYLHEQDPADPWPTLAAMIASGKRLVVLTDDGGATLPWHHYLWSTFAWETHFSAAEPEDFSCADNRGEPANDLFILNHFLTDPIGSILLADQVNHNPFFLDRALQCQTESGKLPNFVTVDFHEVGDVLPVVRSLNGLGPCS